MGQKAREITTETIASLYIKQGYYDKALDIYRAILEIDPSNEAASARMDEVEAMIAGSNSGEPELSKDSGSTSSGPLPVEAQVARLESWLSVIQDMRGRN